MRPRTGRGADQLRPTDIERLPDSALLELLEIYAEAERLGSWPRQLLLVTGQLLGKKGGVRVVGLMRAVAHVWSQARELDVRSWADATSPTWGAAVRGNSAAFEAFVGTADEEAYSALGFACAHAMLGAKSFYDSMSWVKLGRAALRLGFPPTVLALELQLRMAPRTLIRNFSFTEYQGVIVVLARCWQPGAARPIQGTPLHPIFRIGCCRRSKIL